MHAGVYMYSAFMNSMCMLTHVNTLVIVKLWKCMSECST